MTDAEWYEKCDKLEKEIVSLNFQLEIMKELVADLVGVDMETLKDDDEGE